ncbi:polycystin-1-like protein 2 isoform X2 [Asterias amurensis]
MEWTAENGTEVEYLFEFEGNVGEPDTNLTVGGSGANISSLSASGWTLSNFVVQLSSNGLVGTTTFVTDRAGHLRISLLAYNLVNQSRIWANIHVQAPVSGFKVFATPPQRLGDNIVLSYKLSGGTDIIVDMTFMGFQFCKNCVTTDLKGECLLSAYINYHEAGVFEVELNAYNNVSGPLFAMTNLTIQATFNRSDLEVSIIPGLAVVTGREVFVTFALKEGSGVNYEVDYGVENINPVTGFSECLYQEEGDEVSTSHIYTSPGAYLVTIHAWNLLSNITYSDVVRVLNPVAGLLMVEPSFNDLIGVTQEEGLRLAVVFNFSGNDSHRPTDASAVYSFSDVTLQDPMWNISNTDPYPITQLLPVPSHGLYTGSVTVYNLISTNEFPITVALLEVIENFEISASNGFDVIVGEPVYFSLTVTWGSNIMFNVFYGDSTSQNEYTEKDRHTLLSKTYYGIGGYELSIEASNSVGGVTKTANLRVFRRIEGFSLRAPRVNRLSPGGSIAIPVSLYLKKNVAMPSTATVIMDFGFGEPLFFDLLKVNTSSVDYDTTLSHHLGSFPKVYNAAGRFNVTAYISNPASSQNISKEIWIFEEISDVETVVKYNEYLLNNSNDAQDQPAFDAGGIYVPLNHAMVLIAEYTSGNDLVFAWDFGEVPGLTSVTREPREIYLYEAPGTFKATVNVSNPVQFVVSNVTVHVQVPVADVKLTLLDIGDKTSNVTMYFEVSTQSFGTDACYRVDFQDSQSSPVRYFGSKEVCFSTYQTEIVLSEYPFTFEPIDFLTIWEEGGGPHSFNITNIYDNYDQYNINITGSNVVSASTFILPQFVMKPGCFNPKVIVQEANLCNSLYHTCDPGTDYQVYFASVQITILSKVTLQCKSTNEARFQWSVFSTGISPVDDGGMEVQLPADIPTDGPSLGSLIIKPATLSYGWHRIELNVSMVGEHPPIFGKDSIFFRVDASPLVVNIIGGDERTVHYNNTVTLDAIDSTFDPDDPGATQKDFQFVWLCRRKSYFSTTTGNTTEDVESFEEWDKFYEKLIKEAIDRNDEIDASDKLDEKVIDRGGCFGLSNDAVVPKPGGKLKFTTGIIAVSTMPMYYNMEYELKVAVIRRMTLWGRSYDRVGEATQVIDVREGRPPIMLTHCKVNCKSKLNPSNRYSLESKEAFGGNNFFSLYYAWTISKFVSGEWNKVPVSEWEMYSRTGQQQANFVMEPGFFQESQNYQLKLKASRNPDFSNSGNVVLRVEVNDRPTNGSCSISPLEGEALKTNFDISCRDWTDIDLPLTYIFTIMNRVIHSNSQPNLPQPTKLTPGMLEKDFLVLVSIDITDSYGCFTTVNLTVTVGPANFDLDESAEQLDAVTDDIKDLIESGNTDSASSLIIAVADYLNLESSNQENTGEDYGGFLTVRKEMRSTMADLLSKVPVSTIGGVQQMTSAMASISKVPEEVSQQASTDMIDSMERYSVLLEEDSRASTISAETLETTTSLCMEVVENVVEAQHSTKDEGATQDAGLKNMETSEKVVDRLAESITQRMVLGQRAITVNSSKSALILARSPVLWLSDKNFEPGLGNSVQLPKYEDIFSIVDNLTAVSQKVIMRNRNTKMFAIGASDVTSMVVTLTLTNETDGSPIVVTNTSSPIEIWIASVHHPNAVNSTDGDNTGDTGQTAPVGGAMSVHDIDVPFHHALDLTVLSMGTDEMKPAWSYEIILYVFFRESGDPSLDLHDFNCTLHQTVTVWSNISISNDSQTRCFFQSEILDIHLSSQSGSPRVLHVGINHEIVTAISDDGTSIEGSEMSSDQRFHPMSYIFTPALFTCLAINDGEDEWLSKGCQVGENSTSALTQCLCTHLTTFGSGFKIPINKIDLSDSAFLKLHENPVVFIFMVCCLCLYFLVILWARKADKRDILKAGVTPLPDNDPRHHYYYEITVYTGLKRNAGTTATVFLLIGGEQGDSAPRILRDPKRKVFQKGGVDTFLLASPVALGNLNHVRVWHGNQGKNPSWYLNRLMIKDLRTERTFYFMANTWLAVEEGDGMIERVVPVAGRSELTSFGHLFYSKTRRNLSDGHIWFSIFTRPVKSKFTRVQRTTCCLSLLFCTMMANILFYNQDFEAMEGNQVVFRLGSISFTYGDVVIGVISSLMVFPINLIVVQLFRLSRPIPACPCFKKGQRAKGNLTKFRKLSTVSSMSGVSRAMSDLEKELARMESKEIIGSVPSISLNIYSQVNLRPHSSADLENLTSATNYPTPRGGNGCDKTPIIAVKNTKKRKKGIELPWGCCVFAWLLVVASVGVAFWLTIEVAGQFGKDKSIEWLMSMCFSLAQDIFLNQPIKVLFLGIFLSLIIRDPDTEEANDANSSDINLQEDEEYLHSRMTPEELQDPSKMAQLQDLKNEASSKRLAPLSSEELQEAREIRIKEIKMGKIIREIIFYLIFLNLTMLICFGEHDPDIFHMHKSMRNMFVEAGYNGRMRFTKIRGRENFWNYTENVFIPTMYSNSWYNGEPDIPGRTEHSLADKSMHLVGTARFRQLRIKHDICVIPETMINKTQDCRAPYSITDEEDVDFDEGWKAVNQSAKPNYKVQPLAVWKYHSWYNISSFPYLGKHALYNGGGYLADLGITPEESLRVAAYLRENMWVDQYTRAVFMEFVVYNANINIYTTSFLLVEFLPQGGAMAFPYFWSIRLDRYNSTFGIFVLIGQVIYALFILYFLIREIRKILREKKEYFNNSWNGVELCIISLSIASMVFYFYRVDVGNRMIEQRKKYPQMFLNFHYLVNWDQLYVYLSGLVLFLTTVKFLRLLRFNRRLLLFSFTLRRCSKDLAYYTLVFGVVFIAFALFAYALFHLYLRDFSTFVGTVETLFSTILGKFDFQDMISVNRILSPVFFFTYVVIIVFVMLSMFLSIINETFGKVRRDNKALENELEIVEFMMERFKKWSNFSERRLMKKPTKTYNYTEAIDPKDVECDELRDKLSTMVDRLNQFIRSEKGMTGQKVEDRKIFLCP